MLTFVIPTAPYHEAMVEHAIASCLAQTVICRVTVVYDHERKGAGWARNRGLEQITTPFVSFLDADDWIEPDFAEKCLRAYDGRHYIYTDWMAAGYVEAPPRPWSGDGSSHIVTTLLPTAFVRQIGGFDEALPGGEDTDFYWKLTRAGLCGRRVPEALFHYGKGGRRAYTFVHSTEYENVMQAVVDRYKGMSMPQDCGSCGGGSSSNPMPNVPTNEQQVGDVLAETLWQGTRPERGKMTGRIYRGGWNARLWVHPTDIDAAPHLFARVIELPPPVREDDLVAFKRFAGRVNEALGGGKAPVVQDAVAEPVTQGEVAPNVERVLRLYQQNT